MPTRACVQDVISRLVEEQGVGLPADGVDTVKCGDPTSPLRGVVVCFTATFDVLRRASQLGANLVITHEPTFYDHRDAVDWLRDDAVYTAKRRLLEETGIVVWRFHDYLHLSRPDRLVNGMVEALGWREHLISADPVIVDLEPTPLPDLVGTLKERLGVTSVRVAGSTDITCRRVALLPGAPGGRTQIGVLSGEQVDVAVCGEINEWETSEYVRDAASAGIPRALVVLGHAVSEETGMRHVAQWIESQVPDHPVTFIEAGDALSPM